MSIRPVLLETSGADDPAPVLQTFLSDRALGRECHLRSVIAVVDLATGAGALETAPEARRQAATADRVVLTRPDLAPPGARGPLEARLRTLNPHAPICVAVEGRAPAGFLLDEPTLPPPALLAAEAVAPDGAAGRHTPDLATFALVFDRFFAWRALSAAFGLLCGLRGRDLLRAEGLAAVDGCRGPVAVQAVQHVLRPPLEPGAWPDPGDRHFRLVFIARGNLGRASVLDLFRSVAEVARGASG